MNNGQTDCVNNMSTQTTLWNQMKNVMTHPTRYGIIIQKLDRQHMKLLECCMLYDWLTISQLENTLNSSKELQLADDSRLTSQLCIMRIKTILRTIIIQKT